METLFVGELERLKIIVPHGLIINAKIKTQCTLGNVLELVGSPVVLFLYRVSNLPLRVVHSLLIFYLGGISMDKVSGKLTVFFEDPFWVGVFERIEDGRLSVSKVTFGAEPKDYEVQQALKLQQEQNKHERKERSREKKEADELRMFELKQQKKREKHKGH